MTNDHSRLKKVCYTHLYINYYHLRGYMLEAGKPATQRGARNAAISKSIYIRPNKAWAGIKNGYQIIT